MKTYLKKQSQNVRTAICALVMFGAIFAVSCEKEEIQDFAPENSTLKAAVSITNAGFESSFSGWTDVDPSSVSSDANSGSKSAKITGSGGSVSQTVSVSANTDYTLSAYVLGSWRIGAVVNGSRNTRSGTASDWKQESVTFNSGSATSITILAEYNAGEGRFDDFSLESTGTSTPSTSEAPIGSTIWLMASNGKYVCSEIRTTNAPLEADRSAAKTWEAFEVVDAGDGMIALIAYNGNYVCADKKLSNIALAANRTAIGAWEKFTWESQSDGTVALKANANSLYVTATTSVTDAPLRASASSISTNQKFSWGYIGDEPVDPVDPGNGSNIPGVLLGLNSNDWKLNGYIDSPTSNPNYEDDVIEAANSSFSEFTSEYFYSDGTWAYFKAYRGLEGSSSSGNPRSELREMKNGDTYEWSTSGKTNRMRWTTRVDQLSKSHNSDQGGKVCIGQIHGPSNTYDDVIRVQFQGSAAQSTGAIDLVVNGWVAEDDTGDDDGLEITGKGTFYLDTEYTFELIFEDKVVTLNRIDGSTTTQLYQHTNCGSAANYFKVGNYLQSVQNDSYDGTYATVRVKDLTITH